MRKITFNNGITHQQSVKFDPTSGDVMQSKSLSMKTVNLLFAELNESSKHHHRPEHDLDHQPTFFIRRHRAMLESLLPSQQPSDIDEVLGNHLELNSLARATYQTKSSRGVSFHPKPLNLKKFIPEVTIKHSITNQKLSHPLQIPIWTPLLPENEEMSTKISRSRAHTLKHPHNSDHQLKRRKSNLDTKQNSISELSTSTSKDLKLLRVTTVKDLFDEWENLESKVTNQSDGDESLVVHCDSPSLTLSPQIKTQHSDIFTFSTSISNQQLLSFILSDDNSEPNRPKATNSRMHSYNNLLPPVFEDTNNEEAFNDIC
ncbi:unnamed protein product [Rotaria magnacalcarata]|nr:unnamed protein product [Rotaria magnacalcarata]